MDASGAPSTTYCQTALPLAEHVCEDCIVGEACIGQTDSIAEAMATAHLLPSLRVVFVMLRNPLMSEWHWRVGRRGVCCRQWIWGMP